MTKPFKEVIKDSEQALMDLRVASVNVGKQIEQERIIKLWEQEMACKCEDPMNHLIALIKASK